jgi:dihydrofolate reductase
VTALKNQSGEGHIDISGSISVVRQLLAAGLLDELHLLLHPIAVRKVPRATRIPAAATRRRVRRNLDAIPRSDRTPHGIHQS